MKTPLEVAEDALVFVCETISYCETIEACQKYGSRSGALSYAAMGILRRCENAIEEIKRERTSALKGGDKP